MKQKLLGKKRAIVIVLDSVGIGALPDAGEFGDEGSNTIGNIHKHRGKLHIPNMISLGLGGIEGSGLETEDFPKGVFGRAAEKTHAKDTTCGHWEMMGIIMQEPFKTYPNGFPPRIIERFESETGRGILGNCVASGTVIIQELGDEHVATGKPIVYTSADSVFQIAAHEEVIPLQELYNMCEKARAMLVGQDLVGRVIARPFVGKDGNYKRTENRRDYSIPPIEDTVLDGLTGKGLETVCIGKIEDIFFHRGISVSDHTTNNNAGIQAILRFIREGAGDFVFANLVDFDSIFGHRNDVNGYAAALEEFDRRLPEIIEAMYDEDILIITADHGCDPTTPSTDHSREYIPILAYGKKLRSGVNIGTRECFADIGSTVFEYLAGEQWRTGKSFLKEMI